ncbi:metallophosphoesterase [Clostridium aestuarii]|uniref:Metallophosphoesterase n=1 Tax=Clostridium aestuarii TaxID=338193 RepID=A0ABT4D5E5_9CLOT|nr:metallophosphoesterase [Clostridium aestuarii]MCY6485258.1 metallophosphoesterase [Clostridium aestuarii]
MKKIYNMNEKFKCIFYRLIGSIYIPNYIRNINEPLVLHISDTPQDFFQCLKKIIKILKPDYIIHTGDLVDDIKLENYPQSINRYEKKIKILIDILENSHAKDIYLCMGNHDNENIVRKFIKKSSIVRNVEKIIIQNIDFTISHFSEKVLNEPSKYNLFGHDLSIRNKVDYDNTYLNGIININIITLKTGKVFNLPYPYWIDDKRLGRGRAGF